MLRRAHIAVLIGAATLLSGAAPAPAARPDPVTQRPCFGAASRDPLVRCVDPALRRTVFPTPDDALLEPNAPCIPEGRTDLLYPCAFGVRRTSTSDGGGTIALVGDSHASHWRAAVDVVAVRKDMPAVSLTRSRCAFIDATVIAPPDDRRGCRGWNREVRAYLTRHREISTLFVSHRSSAQFATAPGRNNFQTQVEGHIALWRSLPATIENIVVIRDTPRSSAAASQCVRREYAAGRAAAVRCA
ncbi:MAG: SGNH hydrolase domain-containing protein, partial [Solirubrobacteraceae bacterium]